MAEKTVVELPECSTLPDQLVGEAALFEGQEHEEMAEHAGGIPRIRDVVGPEQAGQGLVSHE
jgi:hypothetical protein